MENSEKSSTSFDRVSCGTKQLCLILPFRTQERTQQLTSVLPLDLVENREVRNLGIRLVISGSWSTWFHEMWQW